MKDEGQKTAWDDISRIWKRIAAVIAAVSLITTFIVKVFDTHPEKTLSYTSLGGIILLVISWYVDRQAHYIREELNKHKREASEFINTINTSLSELKTISLDTRKDTLRIQLSMYIKEDTNNIDAILKLAETYFVKLGGDWYMTSEFTKWAKKHDVVIPQDIYAAINTHKGG